MKKILIVSALAIGLFSCTKPSYKAYIQSSIYKNPVTIGIRINGTVMNGYTISNKHELWEYCVELGDTITVFMSKNNSDKENTLEITIANPESKDCKSESFFQQPGETSVFGMRVEELY